MHKDWMILPRSTTRCCFTLLLIAMIVAGFAPAAWAQISSGGTPPSFTLSMTAAVPTAPLPPVDNAAELALDASLPKHEQNRFAAQVDVALNLNNSGVWENLPDGGRLWRLQIASPGAFSIGLLYDQWYIPKGGELFIYNEDRSQVIGAFTSFNNWEGGTNVTHHVAGDAITLEYYEPAAIAGQSVLSISTVCHAYRNYFGYAPPLDNYGDSGACNNNVNCPEGAPWQDEKHGVTMITSGGSRICSGSMINTTAGPTNAYYLTANHCLGNPASWVFVFNYESPGCANQDGPTNQTVANATLRSNWSGSDFALLELSAHPPAAYLPYYNGWNRVDAPSTNSVGIHHPRGDIKKITFDNNAPVNGTWSGTPANSHWRILVWDDGTTEPGSSGSPLFDQNSRITGQLHGGTASCSNNIDDYYGKFSLSWPGNGTNATRLSNWLDPGGTGATTVNGAYRTNPPANDNCPGLTILNLPYTYNGTTADATNSFTHACSGTTSPDVFFRFYAPSCSTTVTVSLCTGTTNYDTGLEVRRGGSCPGTILVDCDDDDCGYPPGYSRIIFNTIPNEVYYIAVFGYSQYTGNYTLNVTGVPAGPAPANDTCPGTGIFSLPYSAGGNTCTANNNYTNCIGPTSKDVVYTLYGTALQCTTNVTVSLCGSGYDTGLEVRAGGACPGNTQIACNDDYCGLQSQATFMAMPNTTYYVIVHGYSSTSAGPYTINVTGTAVGTPPFFDDCPGYYIGVTPFTHSSSTCAATNNFANCVGSTSNDVVYTYTPICSSRVTVSLCGSLYDTGLEVRAGGACPGNTLIACNDDADCGSGFVLQSLVTYNAQPNVQYWFIVHGFSNRAGVYTINVTETPLDPAPPNDVCPGTTITSLPYNDAGSTCNAANNYSTCSMGSSNDVVYTLRLADCQNVTVSLCNSDYDTRLEVRTDGACPGTTQIACNDDACGPFGLQSRVSFDATRDVNYYIIVGGFGANKGRYVLNVAGTPIRPVNDTCPGPLVTTLPYTDSGNTTCAIADYPNLGCGPQDSRDVVYRMILPACQTVRVSLCGSSYDTRLQVNTGGTCPGDVLVACNDDFCGLQSELTMVAQANVPYYILVRGFLATYSGAYTLNITSVAPYVEPGDVCPGVAIAALPYTTTGNTLCSNDDYDDSGCVFGNSREVFYRYTPTQCETVTATLCGSLFDTGLEVRTGGACPGTAQVACNDDDYCGPDFTLQSTVQFSALAGETYYFVVHGYMTNAGPFTFNVTGVPFVAPNDLCPGTVIAALPYNDTGDTRCATGNSADCVEGGGGGNEVYYRLRIPACTDVTATLCGSGFDTGLEVRTGGACPGATQVVCNDDNYCGVPYTLQSTVNFTAQSGVDYYIIVHGFLGLAGPFQLAVTGTPCLVLTPPTALVIQRVGTTNDVRLDWQSTGAPQYRVYRASTPDVPIIPGNFIGSTPTTTFVVSGEIANPALRAFYAVTSSDGAPLAALDPGDVADLSNLTKADAVLTGPIDFVPYGSAEAAIYTRNKAEALPIADGYISLPFGSLSEEDLATAKPVTEPENMMHLFGEGISDEQAAPDKAATMLERFPNAVMNPDQVIYVDPALIGGPNPHKPDLPLPESDAPIYVDPAWIGGPNPNKPATTPR